MISNIEIIIRLHYNHQRILNSVSVASLKTKDEKHTHTVRTHTFPSVFDFPLIKSPADYMDWIGHQSGS